MKTSQKCFKMLAITFVNILTITSSISSAVASKELQRSLASEVYNGVTILAQNGENALSDDDDVGKMKCVNKVRDELFSAKDDKNPELLKEIQSGKLSVVVELSRVEDNAAYSALMVKPGNYTFKQDHLFIRVAFGEIQDDYETHQCDLPYDVQHFLQADDTDGAAGAPQASSR